MTRLQKAVGSVELIDARSDHILVGEIKRLGYDLNQGMIARYQGIDYFGADCLHLLSLLSSKAGWMNRLTSMAFANERIARKSYPVLRTGRNLVLRLLGRRKIE